MKESKVIINPSLYVFISALEESINDGWQVDFEKMPPTQFGICYEVGLIREVEKEFPGGSSESAHDAVAKPSRAEILEKARAAKALKASQE